MAFSLFLPICVINKENLVLSTCSESARLCLSLSSSRADQLFGTQMFYPWCQVVLLACIYLSYLWCGTDSAWRPMYYISIVITPLFYQHLLSTILYPQTFFRFDYSQTKVSWWCDCVCNVSGVIQYQSSSNICRNCCKGPDSSIACL